MKLMQAQKQFAPILLTLETREEAKAIWTAVHERAASKDASKEDRDFLMEISNWFATIAVL